MPERTFGPLTTRKCLHRPFGAGFGHQQGRRRPRDRRSPVLFGTGLRHPLACRRPANRKSPRHFHQFRFVFSSLALSAQGLRERHNPAPADRTSPLHRPFGAGLGHPMGRRRLPDRRFPLPHHPLVRNHSHHPHQSRFVFSSLALSPQGLREQDRTPHHSRSPHDRRSPLRLLRKFDAGSRAPKGSPASPCSTVRRGFSGTRWVAAVSLTDGLLSASNFQLDTAPTTPLNFVLYFRRWLIPHKA